MFYIYARSVYLLEFKDIDELFCGVNNPCKLFLKKTNKLLGKFGKCLKSFNIYTFILYDCCDDEIEDGILCSK